MKLGIMTRFMTSSFLVMLCVMMTSSKNAEDPLCITKKCPSSTTCRVTKTCATPEPSSCVLKAVCLEKPPKFSHTGVCQIGDPILEMDQTELRDTTCGTDLPCPGSTYCNTELMDTYATCCRSHPGNPVKSGVCPTVRGADHFFCVDTCNNDGDCRYSDKCCKTGCRRECMPPREDCSFKPCPPFEYCENGQCRLCPPVCRMMCPNGNVLDPKGCPICSCKPPPYCRPLNCRMICPNGYRVDSGQCPICQCNPPIKRWPDPLRSLVTQVTSFSEQSGEGKPNVYSSIRPSFNGRPYTRSQQQRQKPGQQTPTNDYLMALWLNGWAFQ